MSTPTRAKVVYPDSDGKRMSDNTLQFQWIVTIKEGLDEYLLDDPNVFVGGDLLWYPVEGDPTVRQAPDALVAFGRPKGHRGSYKQWEEAGIAPQVVFEVLSPKNTRPEMERKRQFYERYGAEEYYEYDPDRGKLRGWSQEGGLLVPVSAMEGWVSPRLGVRFGLNGKELVLTVPDGTTFEVPALAIRERNLERRRANAAERRASAAELRAEAEARRAEAEAQRARTAESEAERQRLLAEQLAAKLRELGIEPPAL